MYASAGLILAIDWNAVTGLIISGGEDCKYKVELLGHDPSIFFSVSSRHHLTHHAYGPRSGTRLGGRCTAAARTIIPSRPCAGAPTALPLPSARLIPSVSATNPGGHTPWKSQRSALSTPLHGYVGWQSPLLSFCSLVFHCCRLTLLPIPICPSQTTDNTKLACACANGEALVGEIIGRSVSERHLTVSMTSNNTLEVLNSITGTKDVVGV
jgi:hypothetical protein